MDILLLFTSILTAMTHVLTGPDHLGAITPIMLDAPKKSYRIGWSWATGHCLGVLIIGGLYLFLQKSFSLEHLSNYSEQIVGFVLIAIGLKVIYKLYQEQFQLQPVHLANQVELTVKPPSQHNISSLSVGLLHGLAGIAHFFIFAPVLSFDSLDKSLLYIFGFILGTVIAMTLYALVVTKVVYHTNKKNLSNQPSNTIQKMRFTCALVAILIGSYWIYQNINLGV